jgi:hypothetical protein
LQYYLFVERPPSIAPINEQPASSSNFSTTAFSASTLHRHPGTCRAYVAGNRYAFVLSVELNHHTAFR